MRLRLLCGLLLLGALAGAQSSWKGKSGDYAIAWSATELKVTRGAVAMFDAGADAKATWQGMVKKSNGAPMEAQFTYRLLSMVGAVLSVEEGVYCECGGAHPTALRRFQTLDLARGKVPASLSAIFSQQAVYTALLADPIVVKALDGEAKPKTLAALLDELQDKPAKVKDCEYEFPDDLMSRFALENVDEADVMVRLGLSASAQVCRGELIQLGLNLEMPASWAQRINAAKDAGLVMAALKDKNPASFSFKQGK